MQRFTDGMTEEQIAYFKEHRTRFFDSKALFYAKLYMTKSLSGSDIGDPAEYLAWLLENHPKEWLRIVMPAEGSFSKTLVHLQDVMFDMADKLLPPQLGVSNENKDCS